MNRPLVVSGVLVLGAAWLGPLPELARTSFAAHMIMHVSVVAVAAPLIGIGIAGMLGQRPFFLFAPIPASLFEFLVIWGWHTPYLHHAARASSAAFVAEQVSFFGTGLLLWAASFRRGPESAGGGILALLLTSMHMIFLGTLLTLAPRTLYRHAGTTADAAALSDQQLGGLLMLLGGGVPYLAGGLWLAWRLLQAPRDAAGPSGALR